MLWKAAVTLACAIGVTVVRSAQEPPRTVWDGVYSARQAERGERSYREACGYCHRDNLQGDEGPALAGSRFTFQWSDRTVADLLDAIETTMPASAPGTLTRQTYVDVIAFLLKANDMPAGAVELPPDPERLKMVFTAKAPPPHPRAFGAARRFPAAR